MQPFWNLGNLETCNVLIWMLVKNFVENCTTRWNIWKANFTETTTKQKYRATLFEFTCCHILGTLQIEFKPKRKQNYSFQSPKKRQIWRFENSNL